MSDTPTEETGTGSVANDNGEPAWQQVLTETAYGEASGEGEPSTPESAPDTEVGA